MNISPARIIGLTLCLAASAAVAAGCGATAPQTMDSVEVSDDHYRYLVVDVNGQSVPCVRGKWGDSYSGAKADWGSLSCDWTQWRSEHRQGGDEVRGNGMSGRTMTVNGETLWCVRGKWGGSSAQSTWGGPSCDWGRWRGAHAPGAPDTITGDEAFTSVRLTVNGTSLWCVRGKWGDSWSGSKATWGGPSCDWGRWDGAHRDDGDRVEGDDAYTPVRIEINGASLWCVRGKWGDSFSGSKATWGGPSCDWEHWDGTHPDV